MRTFAGYALPGGPLLEGGGELGGFDPQDLQSAYAIPVSGGATQTVAVIEEFGYPAAESDLAQYRERYGLPPCTKASGCFKKINENGEESDYPPEEEPGWQRESALDLDMVSAACPSCHVILAETDEGLFGLAPTVNAAVNAGATEVSNSYGVPEQFCNAVCSALGRRLFACGCRHHGLCRRLRLRQLLRRRVLAVVPCRPPVRHRRRRDEPLQGRERARLGRARVERTRPLARDRRWVQHAVIPSLLAVATPPAPGGSTTTSLR